MGRPQMTARRWLINVTVVACTVAGDISIRALAATPPALYDPRSDLTTSSNTPPPGIEQIAPDVAVKEQPLTGNPLWGVPLQSLSATRERPIFLPSRRPPAPAVAAT